MARRTKPDEERTRDWLVFRWWVPSKGFEWVEGTRAPLPGARGASDAGPWLLARSELGEEYRPLDDRTRGPLLFRDLADVTDRHTALAFANKYGALGVAEGFLRGAGATTGRILNGESLSRWVREAAHLRAAVQVADAARSKNNARLSQWIGLGKGSAAFSHPEIAGGSVQHAREKDAAFKILGPKLPGLGLLFAQRLVNAVLEKDAAPRVLADAPGKLVLGITPRHLLAAAWMQLARDLTGENTTQFRRCLGCSKWLAIGEGVGRADRMFCGDTCRKRVKRAQQRARKEK